MAPVIIKQHLSVFSLPCPSPSLLIPLSRRLQEHARHTYLKLKCSDIICQYYFLLPQGKRPFTAPHPQVFHDLLLVIVICNPVFINTPQFIHLQAVMIVQVKFSSTLGLVFLNTTTV